MRIIAIDCGGTFTDLVYVDEKGEIRSTKARSTPQDFASGALDAVNNMAALLGMPAHDLLAGLSLFAFSSTVATNMLITRGGAKTGLITTRGFEDTLFIGRIFQKIAGLKEQEVINLARLNKAEPVIPRPLVKGVTERIDYKGAVIIPLNLEETARAARELVEAGVEAIAVATMWSFMNPRHEQEIRQTIKSLYPQLFVSLSSELAPVIGEYERMATTAVNAYVGPVNSRMFLSLTEKLQSAGLSREPMMMQGSGGYTTTGQASEKPVLTLSSGPAGGLVAAMTMGRLLGHENIITADVGGTSFDVGLIIKGQAEFASRPVFAQYHLCVPLLNTTSIGAGGGSIAWLEPATGRVKVGPRSAGADPGPACYSAGGQEPTVTDADLVLHRYSPGNFLGGRVKISPELAARAIEEKIAKPLGLTLPEAALGIVDIVDANMAALVRKITVGSGLDPADFVLLAYGGAGPAHVGAFAPAVGVGRVAIPYHAPVFSALGIAASDVVHIGELSDPLSAPFDPARLTAIFLRLDNEVREELARVGIAQENTFLSRSVDMKYKGQVHEVRVALPGQIDSDAPEKIVAAFEQAYEQKYGRGTGYKAAGIQAITWRVSGRGRTTRPAFKKLPTVSKCPSGTSTGTRDVYFSEARGKTPTKIFDREKLRPGHVVKGPAIIEAKDTTIVIHPGQRATIDGYLNTTLEWG